MYIVIYLSLTYLNIKLKTENIIQIPIKKMKTETLFSYVYTCEHVLIVRFLLSMAL